VVHPIFHPCVWRREDAARGGRPLVRMTGGTGRGGGRRKRNRSRPRQRRFSTGGCDRQRAVDSGARSSSISGADLPSAWAAAPARLLAESLQAAPPSECAQLATGETQCTGGSSDPRGRCHAHPAFRDRSRCSRRLRAARSGSLRRSVGRSRTRRNRGDLSHLPGTAAQLTRSRVGRIYIMCPGAGRRALVRLGYSRTGQLRSQRLGRVDARWRVLFLKC
jgi:hypothetical protein